MKNRIAIYIRTSTLDQNTNMQVDDLQQYCKHRNWQIISIYQDQLSGKRANRPQLKLLLKHAQERKFDKVLVWKLDRFGRSLKDLVVMISNLQEIGVDFLSLKDSIDLSTSGGKLMFHLIASFAEFERATIQERVLSGLEAARKRGKRLGRPKQRNDNQIQLLATQGFSQREIAAKVGLSRGAVQRALAGTKTLAKLKR